MVYRERELRDKDSHEVVFFISSLPVSVKRLAKHLRGHWGIENSLHWSLDVTFGEDKSRIRRGNAPEIAGALRRLALSILKRDTSVKKCSIRGKRLQAGMVQRCPRRNFDWKTRRLRCDSPGMTAGSASGTPGGFGGVEQVIHGGVFSVRPVPVMAPQGVPQILDWIQLRRVRRQVHQRDVRWAA